MQRVITQWADGQIKISNHPAKRSQQDKIWVFSQLMAEVSGVHQTWDTV